VNYWLDLCLYLWASLWQSEHLQWPPHGFPAWKHSQYFFWHYECLQLQPSPFSADNFVCCLLFKLSLRSVFSIVFTQSIQPHLSGSQGNPFFRQSQYPFVQPFLWQLHLILRSYIPDVASPTLLDWEWRMSSVTNNWRWSVKFGRLVTFLD